MWVHKKGRFHKRIRDVASGPASRIAGNLWSRLIVNKPMKLAVCPCILIPFRNGSRSYIIGEIPLWRDVCVISEYQRARALRLWNGISLLDSRFENWRSNCCLVDDFISLLLFGLARSAHLWVFIQWNGRYVVLFRFHKLIRNSKHEVAYLIFYDFWRKAFDVLEWHWKNLKIITGGFMVRLLL